MKNKLIMCQLKRMCKELIIWNMRERFNFNLFFIG